MYKLLIRKKNHIKKYLYLTFKHYGTKLKKKRKKKKEKRKKKRKELHVICICVIPFPLNVTFWISMRWINSICIFLSLITTGLKIWILLRNLFVCISFIYLFIYWKFFVCISWLNDSSFGVVMQPLVVKRGSLW